MKATTKSRVKSVLLGLLCIHTAALLLLPVAASRVLVAYTSWVFGVGVALFGLLLIVGSFLPSGRSRTDQPMKVREL